jgi:O-antigen/teichoic acid export membrane protein
MTQGLVHKILKGGAVVTLGRLLGILSNFALTAVLARVLVHDDMGTYFLAFNLSVFFGIFARFGVEQAALKVFSDRINGQGQEKLMDLARYFSIIILISCSVLAVFFLTAGNWVFAHLLGSVSLSTLTVSLFVWSALLGIQAVNAEIFRAFKHFALASAFKGPLASGLTLIAVLIIWLTGMSLDLARILLVINVVQLCVNVVGAGIIFRFCSRFDLKHELHHSAQGTNINAIAVLAAPLFASQIALFIATQSDLWLLQAFGSASAVAYYGAAARLVLFAGLALQIANAVVPPFISQLRATGEIEKMEHMLRFVATLASIPAVIFMVGVCVFSRELLSLVYGVGYEEASSVLIVLSFAQLVNVLTGSCGYVLMMYGFGRYIMNISIASGVVSIFLAFVFIRLEYGYLAVAIAYAFGSVLQQFLMLYYAWKKCGIYTHVGVLRW